MASPEEQFSGEWKSADQIVSIVEPGDVVEIDIGHASHFVFNIKRGWCVHVITTSVADGLSATRPKFVVKDATDLNQEAGSCPCRIYNFEKVAEENQLIPRSLKDAFQLARAGLAQGPVQLPLSDVVPVDDFKSIAKEFCIHWKFAKPIDTANKGLSCPTWQVIVAIISVAIAAAVSALLLIMS